MQALVNAERRRDAAAAEEGDHRLRIQLGLAQPRQGPQGGQLRGEANYAAARLLEPAPIERFFAKAITGQLEPPLAPIPQRQGEHAGAALQRRLQSPGLNGGQQGFGVGMAAPGRLEQASLLELMAQGQMVVDLSVKGDHVAPAGAGHRLMAGRGEILDRQAPMGERKTCCWITPDAGIIGAAVGDGSGHGLGGGP